MFDTKEILQISVTPITPGMTESQRMDALRNSKDIERQMRETLGRLIALRKSEDQIIRDMPTLTGLNRPLRRLEEMQNRYPDTSNKVNEFRAKAGEDQPEHIKSCLMPVNAWAEVIGETYHVSDFPPALFDELKMLTTSRTWAYGQGFYQMDQDLLNSVCRSVPMSRLPYELFYRLPDYCVYVQAPGLAWELKKMHGFWAHIEWDPDDKRSILQLVLDCEEKLEFMPLILGDGKISELVENTFRVALEPSAPDFLDSPLITEPEKVKEHALFVAESVIPIMHVLFYLCSDKPDIEHEHIPGKLPERPRGIITEQGYKLTPADKPNIWKVGANVGKKLRKFQSELEARGVDELEQLELIRGQWHCDWTGAKEGEGDFTLRWSMPPAIGADV